MMVLEYERDIVIIDVGVMFPENEMLGVDLVIPDVSYLLDKVDRIRGIIITHGHEDHTGSLPYVLPQLNFPPVWATTLTAGLISVKLKEHRLTDKVKMQHHHPGRGGHLRRACGRSSSASATASRTASASPCTPPPG